MQEEKKHSSDVTPTKEDAERDATSSETLSDLEKESAAESRADSGRGSNAGASATPAPDGEFDTPRSGSGKGEDSGPM